MPLALPVLIDTVAELLSREARRLSGDHDDAIAATTSGRRHRRDRGLSDAPRRPRRLSEFQNPKRDHPRHRKTETSHDDAKRFQGRRVRAGRALAEDALDVVREPHT